MTLLYPHSLWLLLVIPALIVYQVRRRNPHEVERLWLQIAMRSLAIVSLVIALARPIWLRNAATESTIQIVQLTEGKSVEQLNEIERLLTLKNKNAAGLVDVIIAGASPVILDSAEVNRPGYLLRARESSGGNFQSFNLEAALQMAATRVHGRGHIHIWSEGPQTHGRADRELTFLLQQGIDVIAEEFPDAAKPALALSIIAPAAVGVGQSADIHVQFEALAPVTVDAALTQASGETVAAKTLAIPAGRSVAKFPVRRFGAGLNSYRLVVKETSGHTTLADQRLAVLSAGSMQVAVVEQDPQAPAAAALQSLLGTSAHITAARANLVDDAAALNNLDALVIADVPAAELSPLAQENIRALLKRGTTVLFTGGPNSLGAGGYAGSSLAELLPVRMPQEQEKADPSTAVAIILDTSGSMEGTRISLAKEVARIAIRRLTPYDKAGIVEFYGSKRWAAPMQSAGNMADLNRAINRLTAGGGTLILPAFEEASFALKNVNTRSRHVVIITDGGVESGPFEQLTRKMADEGICVSTVLVGPAQHSQFLANIAQWGHGHFYQVPDRFNVPEMLFKQPVSQSVPPYVETPAKIIAPVQNLITDEIDWASAPAIQGYTRTTARPTAEKLLATASGEPILARWRFGRGYVSVLTTQLGSRWSADFAQWPQAATLISNLLRSSVPHAASQNLVLNVSAVTDELRVYVQALYQGSQTQTLEIHLRDATGKVLRTRMLEPVKSGQWSCILSHLEPGDYQVDVQSHDRSLRGAAAASVLTSAEIRQTLPGAPLADTLAELKKQIGTIESPSMTQKILELWPYCVLASLSFLLIHVWVRRLPVRLVRNPGGQL